MTTKKSSNANKVEHTENLALGLSVFEGKISRQSSDQTLIETKIGILVGFVSLYLVTVFSLLIENPTLISNKIMVIGLALAIVALFIFISSLWPRKYLDAPNSNSFYTDKHLTKLNIEVKKQLLSDYVKAYNKNGEENANKICCLNLGLITFFVSIIILFVGLFTLNTTQNMAKDKGEIIVPPSKPSGNQVEKGNNTQTGVVVQPSASSGNAKELSE